MVRLSLVNLYLHGFPITRVTSTTLTSDDRWNDHYDVILANPPSHVAQRRHQTHKRFSVQAKRSGCCSSTTSPSTLTPRRAGIIVPRSIIFQSQTAYKELRKMLVVAVTGGGDFLPAGCSTVFGRQRPPSSSSSHGGTRTVDRREIPSENDGYGLLRTATSDAGSDLPQVKKELDEYLSALRQRR